MSLSKAHHVRRELCTTRSAYRSGRQLKAVKVYTVSQESRYLLVQGIPALGVYEDLVKEFALYGAIEEYRLLDEYPAEEFTEVMWIKYVRIQSARLAKRKLDDYEYCGGKLHVCYAPEYETIEDTRAKLDDRRRAVARRIQQLTGKGKAASQSSGMDDGTTASAESSASLVHLTAVDVEKTTAHGEPSSDSLVSMTTQPPPPLPPAPSSAFPPYLTLALANSFPPLPPPPVERLPVRLPPRHIHPDVRWRFGTLGHSTGFPQPFHPPVPIPSVPPLPHLSNFLPQFVPISHRTQTPHSRTVPDQNTSETGESLPTSLPAVISPISKTVSTESSSKPIIREFKTIGASPRFVPRQVNATRSGSKIPQTADPVIVELKQNAFILGSKVQGPLLPSETERKRKQFQTSETGDESLDKTVHAVRQKVSQLSEAAPAAKEVKEV